MCRIHKQRSRFNQTNGPPLTKKQNYLITPQISTGDEEAIHTQSSVLRETLADPQETTTYKSEGFKQRQHTKSSLHQGVQAHTATATPLHLVRVGNRIATLTVW